jgi:hypothetical protein
MNKIALYAVGVVVLGIAGFFLLNSFIYTEKQGDGGFEDGYQDIAYTIEGKVVDLEDGEATVDGLTYTIMGEETEGDLSEDGISDLAFVITQKSGTTTKYYLVAAVRSDGAYRGTGGALLGENIEIAGVDSLNGGVVVRYMTTGGGEQASTTASTTSATERSRFFVVINGEIESMAMPE